MDKLPASPRPDRGCHTWVSAMGPFSDPLHGQGTRLAASQTLPPSGAFFPDKGPAWGTCMSPRVGNVRERKDFLNACTLIFCDISSQSCCSPPGLAALPASRC